jgi:uncharacterized protein YndB with AHSA1/START domain
MSASYVEKLSADTVRVERTLPGPIERVWAFLTEPEKRGRWLAAGDMSLTAGGEVELVFNNSALTDDDDAPPAKYAAHANESRLRGRVLECDPPRLLSYTWGEASDASEVRFELDQHDQGVRLVVVHTRLRNRDQMLSVAGGWHTHLDILADRLHDRPPPGFWRTHTRLEAEYERRLAQAR